MEKKKKVSTNFIGFFPKPYKIAVMVLLFNHCKRRLKASALALRIDNPPVANSLTLLSNALSSPVFLSPSEAEPQLGTLTLTNVTPDSFNLSWTTRDGPFAKFVIHIRDSYAAHEPQELTVSGGARSAHISGLLDYTGYDINIKGTTDAGVHTEPLTAFVMTGTCLKAWGIFISL